MPRSLMTLLLLPLLATAWAQDHGNWVVESHLDAFSFNGLGSLWLEPYQTPVGLTAEEALLVVGCDASSPNGFEVLVQVGYDLIALTENDDGDLAMLVRFDQGAILDQSWFLAEGFFGQEVVAYYDMNEDLFAGLRSGSNLALRVQADPGRGVPEMTFQYDVRGFGAALASLACGEPSDAWDDEGWEWEDDGDWEWADDDLQVGSWSFDGDFGMISSEIADGFNVVAIYCSESADGNGIEVDLGDYELTTGDRFDVTFRSGNIDFLSASATVNGYGAAQLDTDVSEDRLLRYLRGVVDLTVVLKPAAGGATISYTVGNQDFVAAIGMLGCSPVGF